MKYYIDLNYPGVTYVTTDELAKRFVDYMAEEGAAIREVSCVQNFDDIRVVTGIREEPGNWGLDITKGIFYGEAFIHDGWMYAPGCYCDRTDTVYKTADEKICRFENGAFVECVDWDRLTQIKKPAVTIYSDYDEDDDVGDVWIDWNEQEREEEIAQNEADLFAVQDKMNGIKTRY
jgi:hypothetical protein